MFPKPIATRGFISRTGYRIAVPIVLLLWMVPLIAVFSASIRPIEDILRGNLFGPPTYFALHQNYQAVLTQSDFLAALFRTLRITVPCAILTVTVAALAAFALTNVRSRFVTAVFLLMIAGNFVPYAILFIPVRSLAITTGLFNTAPGLVLFHAAFQMGFCVFFMRNFMSNLPKALMESARLEGVKEWQIFVYIVVPLIRPAIAALLVLVFTFVWNDYFWATALTQAGSARPIMGTIETLNGQFVGRHNLTSLASLMAAAPPVALFFMMQKHFIAGLTFGALK